MAATPAPTPVRRRPARYAAGFAPHVDAGASPFAALTPTPARASSLGGTLDADLAAFATKAGNGMWPNLPRAQIASRLTELVADPTRLNQAGLNACGGAAAMYLFAKRRRDEFARLAMDLYDTGQGQFGTIRVSGSGLTAKDPSKMSWSAGGVPPLLDWMLLSAVMRGNSSHFDGEPSDSVSGITLPGELEDWLDDGVRYSHVSDEANKFLTKGIDHLERLKPSDREDIVVLINADVVQAHSGSTGVLGDAWDAVTGAVLDQFPNHWFVLERPIERRGDIAMIIATGWSWGTSGHVFKGSIFDWMKGYYGAIRATV